jgi:phage shock protein E
MKTAKLIPRLAGGVTAAILALAAVPVTAGDEDPKPAVPAVAAAPAVAPGAALKLLREKDDVVALDVRTPREFGEGHIHGATNIDSRSADFRDRLGALDRSKAYLVHCTRGLKRTADTAATLRELGFTRVLTIEGGLKAWEADGKPLEKQDSTPGIVASPSTKP